MKATELCPSPHIEAAELDGDMPVTIAAVDFAEVGEEKVRKGVVFFAEFKGRGMVLNRTNLKRIIELHGNETDQWTGKQITLYPSETDFQGRTVDCIRVRQKK